MLDAVPSELLPIDVAPGLLLVNERMPGITRRPVGGGFAYVGPDARPVTAAAERARILALGIPGSYAEVWICPLPNGHLQAAARDPLGRKRYRYHPGWRDWRAEAGLTQLLPVGRALAALRARIDRDLERRTEDARHGLAALAVLLDCRPVIASAQRRSRRTELLRSLRAEREPAALAGAEGVSRRQLDQYLAEASGVDAVSARSLMAWTASTAAFAAAVDARDALDIRAMAEAAALSLAPATAAAGIAHVDPDVLALADLAPAERRDRLDRVPTEGQARLRPGERRYLGFLERARRAR